MGTWITHLRIAEKVIPEFPGLDETSFLYGSFAPDSGFPNEDSTRYDPPKEVTHFLGENNGEVLIKDLVFYRDYLKEVDVYREKAKYSFRLGYYVHLLTDQFWWDKIVTPTKKHNHELFLNNSLGVASAIVKTDWYDLDHKYLRDHASFAVWQRFFKSDIPQISLPFLSQEAFEMQMKNIKEYYTTPDPERILDRFYPYFNEKTLDRFIEETSTAVIGLIKILDENRQIDSTSLSLIWLTNTDTSAYEFPLGDKIR